MAEQQPARRSKQSEQLEELNRQVHELWVTVFGITEPQRDASLTNRVTTMWRTTRRVIKWLAGLGTVIVTTAAIKLLENLW